MSQWVAEITNNPEKDYELYVELLEDDEYRARIEMADSASLVLRVYNTETDVVLPVDWLAQHIAAEMQGIHEGLGTPTGLLALVLTDNTALFTAISNDVGYHDAFRRQVEAILRGDDLVMGLSTSGSSPNVIAGIRAAQQIG